MSFFVDSTRSRMNMKPLFHAWGFIFNAEFAEAAKVFAEFENTTLTEILHDIQDFYQIDCIGGSFD